MRESTTLAFALALALGLASGAARAEEPSPPPRVTLDGIEVVRVGTRSTFPFLARRAWRRTLAPRGYDAIVVIDEQVIDLKELSVRPFE